MVKDFLVDNIVGYVIYFCDEAVSIVKFDIKDKYSFIVYMSVVSVKMGDYCYYGLCDVGVSVSVIFFILY